jgi:hypothetical protein
VRRGAVIAIVATGSAVALAGIGAAWWVSSLTPSAADAADDYVTALAAGDIDTLADLGAFEGDTQTVRDAFAGASGFVTQVELEDHGAGSDDSHGFSAWVDLGDERRELFFVLSRATGRWQLAGDHLGTLRVSTTLGDAVQVGDAFVAAGEVALLPAEYPVRAAPVELIDGESVAAVSGDRPVDVHIDATLSPDAAARAQQQFDVYLDQCTAGGAEIPARCGIVVPWGVDLAAVTRFSYRVEARPQLALDPTQRRFAASGGDVVVTVEGAAHDGSPASITYRDANWMLRGGMDFVGDELVLEVW